MQFGGRRMSHSAVRVAIVSDAQPERNGVGTYYRDLAEHLSGRLERVELLSAGASETPLPCWLDVPLPGDATQRVELPSPVALRRRLECLAPDTVVIATPGPYGLLGARYARRAGARLVFGLHTDYEALSSLYWGAVLGRVNRWVLGAANRRLVRQADCVVAISRPMADLARRAGGRDVRLLGTQLPPHFLGPAREQRGDGLRRVLFVGRLAAEKRVPQVIEAAERLRDVSFEVAGDGPLRPFVEAACHRLPNLHYHGWLARCEIRDAIDATDVLILPSVVEAFGTVALEALARGRNALVSPGCGIRDWPELVRALYEIGPDEHPAEAIARIAAMPTAERHWRASLGCRAVHAMTARTVDHWAELLAGSRPVGEAA